MHQEIELEHGTLIPLRETIPGSFVSQTGAYRVLQRSCTTTLDDLGRRVGMSVFTYYQGKPYLYRRHN